MKTNKKSERAAAREYGITKTSLRRYKEKIEKEFPNFNEAADEEMKMFVCLFNSTGFQPNART